MSDERVTPLRTSHRDKEARLAKMRARFDDAHPAGKRRKIGLPAGKALLVALAIAALMIWLASTIAAQ